MENRSTAVASATPLAEIRSHTSGSAWAAAEAVAAAAASSAASAAVASVAAVPRRISRAQAGASVPADAPQPANRAAERPTPPRWAGWSRRPCPACGTAPGGSRHRFAPGSGRSPAGTPAPTRLDGRVPGRPSTRPDGAGTGRIRSDQYIGQLLPPVRGSGVDAQVPVAERAGSVRAPHGDLDVRRVRCEAPYGARRCACGNVRGSARGNVRCHSGPVRRPEVGPATVVPRVPVSSTARKRPTVVTGVVTLCIERFVPVAMSWSAPVTAPSPDRADPAPVREGRPSSVTGFRLPAACRSRSLRYIRSRILRANRPGSEEIRAATRR